MNIEAYTYEGNVHCIDCTAKWAESESLRRGGGGSVRISEHNLIEYQVTYFNGLVYDSTVAPNPLFNAEKPSVFEDGTCDHDWDWQCVCNNDQHLVCGDCHDIIATYTVEGVTA